MGLLVNIFSIRLSSLVRADVAGNGQGGHAFMVSNGNVDDDENFSRFSL